jgi:AcrR family transcriptional regulator
MPLPARQDHVLDVAGELFYARGVHEVGMDELIRATGFGKATVYRLFPTKDELIGAYLQRRADRIHALIDADIERHSASPAAAIRALFAAVAEDVARDGFRGCAFNNASIEFADPGHPARRVARQYRAGLLERLRRLTRALAGGRAGRDLADELALVIDGMYTSAAHLGPGGPARRGPALARALVARHSR